MFERPLAIMFDQRIPLSVVKSASLLTLNRNTHYDVVDVRSTAIGKNRIEFVFCDGYCAKHTDWDEVSVLWVVRNDLKSWVGATGVKVVRPQPVGTIIVLDINHEHRLTNPRGCGSKYGLWAAVNIAALKQWPTQAEVVKYIKRFRREPQKFGDAYAR